MTKDYKSLNRKYHKEISRGNPMKDTLPRFLWLRLGKSSEILESLIYLVEIRMQGSGETSIFPFGTFHILPSVTVQGNWTAEKQHGVKCPDQLATVWPDRLMNLQLKIPKCYPQSLCLTVAGLLWGHWNFTLRKSWGWREVRNQRQPQSLVIRTWVYCPNGQLQQVSWQ